MFAQDFFRRLARVRVYLYILAAALLFLLIFTVIRFDFFNLIFLGCPSTVKDADGYIYPTVLIGDQCWMAKNLNVGVFVESIYTGSYHSDVSNNGIIEKYCYDNSEANCATDGGLYDWNEMMGYTTTEGAQGICPDGWHIPTDAEWHILESGLATGACSAYRSYWSGDGWSCSPAGTDLRFGGVSGFAALLAGGRLTSVSFYYRDSGAGFWSSSESGSDAWARNLSSVSSSVGRDDENQSHGYSVRCIKD